MPRSEDEALISVRLFTMEHYIADPIPGLDVTFSPSRGYAVRKVPVLRVFGATPAGQKCCLHLHGVFPYLLVPVPPNADDGFAFRLASSLDRAINITLAQSESRAQHVFKVDEVSGVPFYGYHPRPHSFFKVYLYNPLLVRRASEMLLNGVVMDMKLQPHESHVPYTLQFMMDYEIQGMSFVRLACSKFRRRSADAPQSPDSEEEWLRAVKSAPASSRFFRSGEMPSEVFLDPEQHPPMSTSELELDAVAADILVPESGGCEEESGMNPGLKTIWTDERERRSVLGLTNALTPPSSPPRPETSGMATDSDDFWAAKLRAKLDKLRSCTDKFLSDPGASTSRNADPDATCNLNPGGSLSQKSRVYPVETPEGIVLKKAMSVEAHVPSQLSNSQRGEKRKRSGEEDEEEEAERSQMVLIGTDDTIVDEDLLNPSQASGETFDDDDKELIELFAALGEDREGEESRSRASRRSSQLDEEDERETQEMSQIIDCERDDLSSPQSTKVPEDVNDEDDLWDADDDSFWNSLDVDKFLHGASKP